MKILVCLSLLIVATATCNTQTEDATKTEAQNHNEITPPEYSRVNQEVYKAYATPSPSSSQRGTPPYTVPPLPKIEPITYKTVTPPIPTSPTRTFRIEDFRKPEAIKAAPAPPVIYRSTPAVRRVIEEANPVDYNAQLFSVPKRVVQTYSPPAVRNLNENRPADGYANDYTDQGVETDEYQPEEYPLVPITVPVRVIHRRYRIPTYRRPSYSRLFNPVPSAYRSVVPVAYSVPSIRNFRYRYPSTSGGVRYTYGSRNVGYDNGAPDYDGFIDEYDEFSKKK